MWKCKLCGGEVVLIENIDQTWRIDKYEMSTEFLGEPVGLKTYYLCGDCNKKSLKDIKKIATWKE